MSKPLFTKKHYKAIAEKFAGLINSANDKELYGIQYCAKAFSIEFYLDNPKFETSRFILGINKLLGSSKNHITIGW